MIVDKKTQEVLYWSSRVLILIVALSGAAAAFGFMPPMGAQIAGAVAALAGIGARWCEQQLPPKKNMSPGE